MSPIPMLEVARSAPGNTIRPDLAAGLRAIACASTIAACRTAIAAAALALEEQTAFAVMVAEVAPSLRGPAILWRTGQAGDEAALLDWFGHAQDHPATLLDFGRGGTALAAAAGLDSNWVIVAVDGVPPDGLGQAMEDMAQVAAHQLARLRADTQMRARELRLKNEVVHLADLARAAADLLWEAQGDGVLKVTQDFRPGLAQHVAGRRLAEILPDAPQLLADGQPLRHQAISIPGMAEEFFLTAWPCGENKLRGLIVAGAARAQAALDAAVVDAVMSARHREERLRRETEVMLLGLRLLLDGQPFHDKMEQLARNIARVIGCDDVRLLRQRPGEGVSAVFPPAPAADGMTRLENILAAARGLTVFGRAGDQAAFLQNVLAMRPGDIALVMLPAEAEHYYLLCRARDGLSAVDAGTAERTALLMQHAVLMRADQQRIVHAGKLSALGRMSTSIAHELRQPLNTISIAAQNIQLMLEMDAITAAGLQEKSDRILSQVDRACKVMDRMRRFGRKTAGAYLPVSLAAIAGSARALMDKPAGECGVTIELDIPDALSVLADELEIEQVLVNLIQNATDAIREAGPAGVVHLRAAADADPAMVRLEVADNGPGFFAAACAHALDAFFTTKPPGKGTGLGLSIAHSIMREHGGRLLVASSQEGGLVTLVLPRAGKGAA